MADDDAAASTTHPQTPPPPAALTNPQQPPPPQLFSTRTDIYTPDTIDFHTDAAARDYWLQCFPAVVGKFAAQAARDASVADAADRAEAYRLDYIRWLDELKQQQQQQDQPSNDADDTTPADNNNRSAAAAAFSIRTLLDRNELLLRRHGFADPWREVKRTENRLAVAELATRLAELDRLREDEASLRSYWTELFRGVFAGNVFDWGAQAVTAIREQYAGDRAPFGLTEALQHIQARPWLVDDLDRWLEVAVDRPPHRCAAVFVDNSGADIVLGVLPFVRELLRRGTRVILCANREPSLNDITCAELKVLVAECAEQCVYLREALDGGRLLVADNGQSGPCLDMRHLSEELRHLIERHHVDLLVIEGMGRALHTNFNVPFACDTLKLAVVKNAWWAQRLGGENFAVICRFEPHQQKVDAEASENRP